MAKSTISILFFLALLLCSLRATASESELLKQVCVDTPVEDSCEIAKNYPEHDGCSLRLDGTKAQGRYVDPGTDNPDGSILLLGYTSNCEPHGNNWGGSLVFDKRDSAYVFAGYQPGFVFEKCINVGEGRKERLLCLSRFMQQGFGSTTLSEIKFGRDSAGTLSVDRQSLFDGLDVTGMYGANTVRCGSNIEVFDFDQLTPGPTSSSVRVGVSYVDEAEIAKACASGAKPPKEVAEDMTTGKTFTAPEGEAFIGNARIRKGYFVLDLNTHQLVSEEGGKSFSPRQRPGGGAQ